jgi:hypothetical protein
MVLLSGHVQDRSLRQEKLVLDSRPIETFLSSPLTMKAGSPAVAGLGREDKHEFRKHFQRSLKRCAAKGFSVEECFGIVWEETLDRNRLSEPDQKELYDELILWAKRKAFESEGVSKDGRAKARSIGLGASAKGGPPRERPR